MKRVGEEIKITIPKEQLWENLRISNDFIFAKVIRNQELCKGILERLLGIHIEHVEYPEEQKVIDITKDSKSVRLDVYVKDDKNTVYNIEIQTADTRELPKRSRYYQSLIDLNLLEKGEHYKKLNQSFVIFICTFDLFGQGRHRYTFENLCKEDKTLSLGDGTAKIFFNTTGVMDDVDDDARNFLSFVNGSGAEDDFTRRLEEEIRKVKENREWRLEYMTLLMRDQENLEKGREEGRIEGIINTLLDLGYSDGEVISTLQKKLKITEEKAESYLEKYYENYL